VVWPAELLDLDWRSAWWQPWRLQASPVIERLSSGMPLPEALNASAVALECPIRFTPQSSLPQSEAYEAFIFQSKTVPTRENAHDFFNGLAWLRFPRAKAQLNALQALQIAHDGVQSLRGPVRDALTLFDENAAFLSRHLHAPILQALQCRDWHAVFQTHRALLREHPPILFGHALLEKLVQPYAAITTHVYAIETSLQDWPANPRDRATWDALDQQIAAQLSQQSWQPKPFLALPVLGIPGWWAANESLDFYTDSMVFRPPRP
jgi:hypothetical protein